MATSRDALFTVRGLIARCREESGLGRSPIGYRKVRELIDAGTLPAVDLGGGDVVRWGDFLDAIARLAEAREPVAPKPTMGDRVERDVIARVRSEREREARRVREDGAA